MSPIRIYTANAEENTMIRVAMHEIVNGFLLQEGSKAELAIGELDPEINIRGGMLKRPAKTLSIEGTSRGGLVNGELLENGKEKILDRGVVVRGESGF